MSDDDETLRWAVSPSDGPQPLAETRSGAISVASDTAVEVSSHPAASDTDRLSRALPGDGARMGRFVLLERVGAGAMGVVYAAYDGTLDRKVAIKLIRRSGTEEDRVRIRREAQAMARLSHANVARIYEAGEHEGRLYLAMEFIDGEGLDRWQSAQHGWKRVLDVYLEVGAGLAAAHAAGILHRDFKPHNVLLGRDGRPRVIDFGLARAPNAALEDGPIDTERSDSGLGQAVTEEGQVVGTPAYMPLEQFMGRALDARTDQFAFCVGLYEALYGQPPFPRDGGIPTLVAALEQHRVAPPPPDSDVPDWLHRAVVRGLAPDPDERWPSMDALRAELSHDRDVDPETGRRQRLLMVLSVALVGIGTSVAAALTGHYADPDPDVALAYGLSVAAVTYVGLFAVRGVVLRTSYNRRITSYFVAAVTLVAVSRFVSWRFGASGLVMYTLENVGLTALSALGALHVARWLWSLAIVLGIGVCLTVIWPARQDLFYAASISIACCLAVFYTVDRRQTSETP